MVKKIFWSFFYFSILFLVFYLYQADYFSIPVIRSYPALLTSFIFLLSGLFFLAVNWQKALSVFDIRISFPIALISTGLTIFMKYIPGKVMSIMGRASYVSMDINKSIKLAIIASLLDQVIILWAGILIGSLILFYIDIGPLFKLLTFLVFIVFSVIIFMPSGINYLLRWIGRLKGSSTNPPMVNSTSFIKILPVFILTWLLWSIGFYFFSISLFPQYDNFLIAFVLPLATTLAMISLIAPGGIGIREGLLAAGLSIFGINTPDAITISVASRLWFLSGELLLFITALLLKKCIPVHHE